MYPVSFSAFLCRENPVFGGNPLVVNGLLRSVSLSMPCRWIGAMYPESVIRVENAVVIVVDGIPLDLGRDRLELLTDLVHHFLATNDLEPVVLIVVDDLGLVTVLVDRL